MAQLAATAVTRSLCVAVRVILGSIPVETEKITLVLVNPSLTMALIFPILCNPVDHLTMMTLILDMAMTITCWTAPTTTDLVDRLGI